MNFHVGPFVCLLPFVISRGPMANTSSCTPETLVYFPMHKHIGFVVPRAGCKGTEGTSMHIQADKRKLQERLHQKWHWGYTLNLHQYDPTMTLPYGPWNFLQVSGSVTVPQRGEHPVTQHEPFVSCRRDSHICDCCILRVTSYHLLRTLPLHLPSLPDVRPYHSRLAVRLFRHRTVGQYAGPHWRWHSGFTTKGQQAFGAHTRR